MQYASVPVPPEHLPAVLRYVASLIEPIEGVAVETEREWPDDLLERLYWDSAESTIAVLVALAKQPGQWATTDELAVALGPDASWRSVAGALSPMTKRQKAYGQTAWPFELRQDPKTERWHYRMTERTAGIILRLHTSLDDLIDEITSDAD